MNAPMPFAQMVELQSLYLRVVSGGTPSRAMPEYFEGGTIPWMKTGEVKQRFVYQTEEHITELGLENSSAKLIPANSLVVAMYGDGDTAGNVAINKVPLTTNQACCNFVVDERKADYRFLFHYIKANYDNLVNLKLGGSQQNLNAATLKRFPVPEVPLATQRKIAAILSAYDDLIANNQRRIALLEGMAEEIYREWFVRMRFPGRDSGELEGLLPRGWARRPLGEITSLIKRGVSPDYADQGDGIVLNQKCIRDGKVSLDESRHHQTRVPAEKYLQPGDVLINSTGVGTLGRVAVYDLQVVGVTCDSHVTILRPNSERVQPAYLAPTVAFLQGYFESMAAGSTGQSELSRELIARTKVVTPSEMVQELFAERVTGMTRQRRVLQDMNTSLAQTRDALLPRLISGKLKIDQLDIRLPASMQDSVTA